MAVQLEVSKTIGLTSCRLIDNSEASRYRELRLTEEGQLMLTKPLASHYFVLSAEALVRLPNRISRLPPDRILICRSSIDALGAHPFYRRGSKELRDYVDHLVSRGAQILESSGRRPIQWVSFLNIRDKRPEVLACQKAIGDKAPRFFLIGNDSDSLAPGEEARISHPEYESPRDELRDEETFEFARAYGKAIIWGMSATFGRFFLNLVIAYIAFLAALFFANALFQKPSDYNSVAVVVAVLALGILIYLWRERAKLSYGLFEVIVGIAIAYNVFAENASAPETPSTAAILQFAAGLYVIVRGMDNVGKSLSGTIVERPWRSIFEGPVSGGTDIDAAIGQRALGILARDPKLFEK